MVSLMDQNVSKNEMKELLKYLAKSAELRDKFIEFENFETLSYKSLHTEGVTMPKDVEEETPLDATLDDFENLNETDLLSSDEENQNEQTMEESTEENQEAANELEDLNSVNDIGDIGDINDLDGLGDIDSSDLMGAEEEITTEAANQNPDDSIANGLNDLASLAETAAAGALLENAAEAAVADAGINTVESVAEAGFDILSDTVENLSSEISPEALPENTADMTLGEADLPDLNSDLSSLEDITATNESAGLMPVDESESNGNETQDFSTIETVEVPQAMPQEAESEMEVLDISNVNAVPNNLDANISETIEFNNIEQADNEPCSNELNVETTAPTVSIDNIDSFNGLEPLNPEDMTYPDNSVDIENLSVASMDTMQPINPMPVNDGGMDPFAAVDLDSISLVDSIPQNNGANIQKKNEEIANSIDEDALNSSLDEIPDFGNELGMGLDSLDRIPDLGSAPVQPVQQAEPQQAAMVSDDIMPAQNESSEISDFNALESLTVDDIVEAPQEDLAQMSEIPADAVAESVQPAAQEVSSMSEIPDENPEFTAIAGLDDLTGESSVEELSESSPEDTDDNQGYETEEDPELRMLFNENADTQLSNTEQIQTLDSPFLNRQPAKSQNSLKKVLVAVIAAVLLGGTFFLFTMKNRNNPAELESLAQNEPETEIPAEAPAATATDAPAATDNSDILANTPAVETIPAAQSEPKNTKEVKPAASAAKGTKPINPPGTYMSVKKLSWEVPDYLSYSNNINKYLQTAGKSIKLSLSSDLLLTNEYAYSNQVKVSMKLSNDGTLKDIQLVKSSGSDQINKIVLQTVKDTLNVIKPATGEVPTPEFKLGLTINF